MVAACRNSAVSRSSGRLSKEKGRIARSGLRPKSKWGYFFSFLSPPFFSGAFFSAGAAAFLSPGAAAAGAAPGAPAAAAAASPSAGFSSSFAFFAFFTTTLITFTLGKPKGLLPGGQRSSSMSVLMRSVRVSTLRARCSEFLRRRLLSIDMVVPSFKHRAQHAEHLRILHGHGKERQGLSQFPPCPLRIYFQEQKTGLQGALT